MSAGQLLAKLKIDTADQMHELGLKLGSLLQAGDLLVLNGPLGAGKTTLTRGIGQALKTEGMVSSPTFVIARTHPLPDAKALVHVDAYRLSSPAELDDLDIDYPNSITVVEWGAGFTEGLVESWLELEIERDHSGQSEVRDVTVTGFGARWQDVTL
jgi:tRNA threonylcarbamoyl adenosine modification protein YjeE